MVAYDDALCGAGCWPARADERRGRQWSAADAALGSGPSGLGALSRSVDAEGKDLPPFRWWQSEHPIWHTQRHEPIMHRALRQGHEAYCLGRASEYETDQQR